MNISSISSASSSAYSTVNNNNEVAQLKKEKADLQKELQKVLQSKDDEETKQQKIQQLQLQIQQIDSQIQGNSTTSNVNTQNTDDRKGPEQFFTDAASVLGISDDDLKSELQSGNDLQTIIEEQGLTMGDFQQQMTTLLNSHQSSNVDQIGYFVDEAI